MPCEISEHPKKVYNKFISKIIGNAELKIRAFTRLDNKLDQNRSKIKARGPGTSPSASNNFITFRIVITVKSHIIARTIGADQ